MIEILEMIGGIEEKVVKVKHSFAVLKTICFRARTEKHKCPEVRRNYSQMRKD